MLAGVGHGLLRDLGRVDLLRTLVAERMRHHPIGLVAVLGRQLAMPVQHLGRRLDLFGIAGPVRRHLGSPGSLAADLSAARL